ncbi:MAG: hypothetical protein JSS53_04175 [Proteobacteria bacterium]|nr:hypothetical protein [Pseudomonadota bacterium]
MSAPLLYLDSLQLDVFQSVDLPIFVKDIKSQYLWANNFFIAKSAGYHSVNEIYHKQDYDFSWHEYANELRTHDKQLFDLQESISVRERILRHEGTYVDIITKKCPLYDKDKKIIGLIGFSIELLTSSNLRVLSQREYTVTAMMANGLTDKKIAKKLNISPRTVETHIINAKQKLNVRTRSELIVKISQGKY